MTISRTRRVLMNTIWDYMEDYHTRVLPYHAKDTLDPTEQDIVDTYNAYNEHLSKSAGYLLFHEEIQVLWDVFDNSWEGETKRRPVNDSTDTTLDR